MRPDHVLPKGSEAAHGTLGKIYSVHVIDGATTNWTRPGEKLSSTCHAEACMAAWHKTTFHCFQTCQVGRLSCSCCAGCRIHLHLFIGTSHTSQYCPVPAPAPNVTACLLQSSCLSPPCRLHHCARGGAFPCSWHTHPRNHSIPRPDLTSLPMSIAVPAMPATMRLSLVINEPQTTRHA